MTLVIVLAAIAAAGLLMLVGYAIWLAHKTSDLLAELKVLGNRGAEFGQIVGQIQLQDPPARGGIGGSPVHEQPVARRSADGDTIDSA